MTISIYARLIIYPGIVYLSVIAIQRMKLSPLYIRENSFGAIFPILAPVESTISTSQHGSCPSPPARTSVKAILPEWDSSQYIEGKPTMAFRDNLPEDKFYITGMAGAGFTNQFMSYVDMIYLGINDLPYAYPGIKAWSAGAIPLGHIFNISRARDEIKHPLLVWMDIKYRPSITSIDAPPPSERERLGCWSTQSEDTPSPWGIQSLENYLQLDISYTRTPKEVRHDPNSKVDKHIVFSHLVPYIFPGSPLSPSNKPRPLMQVSPLGRSLPPDEHLACFDLLYYATSSSEAFEWEFLWSPAWNLVVTHLHFTDDLIRIAKVYLGRAFLRPVDGNPPFIAIHMRRNDFEDKCGLDKFVMCFISLGTFQRIASSVKEEIYYRDNIKIKHILLTSDEKDLAFWYEAKRLGWVHIDHIDEKTQETYGEWYLPIIDMIVQSMAAGFLGTKDSTFSLVSSRRIRHWNDGPAILLSQTDRTEVDFVSYNY